MNDNKLKLYWEEFDKISFFERFYLGFEFNPRIKVFGRELDIKMFYY